MKTLKDKREIQCNSSFHKGDICDDCEKIYYEEDLKQAIKKLKEILGYECDNEIDKIFGNF